MINRKRESGFFNPFVVAITAMALCLVLAIRATPALTHVTATQDTWATETYGPYGYSAPFEAMPDMFE